MNRTEPINPGQEESATQVPFQAEPAELTPQENILYHKVIACYFSFVIALVFVGHYYPFFVYTALAFQLVCVTVMHLMAAIRENGQAKLLRLSRYTVMVICSIGIVYSSNRLFTLTL